MLQFSVTLSPVEVLACKFCKEYFNGYLLEVSEVWNGYELLVVLHCASRPVYIEYKSLEGQVTSGYIWQPTIHNIYLTKYIPIYMVVYYTEYIVYQIYPDIYDSLLYRIYSLPNIL
jgi:hypothetical protein